MVMSTERPTVFVRMADAGDLYTSWRWSGDTYSGGVSVVTAAQLDEALAALTPAVPNAAVPENLEYVLTVADFATYDAEHALAQQLSRTFLPFGLAAQLHELYTRGVRPHIRIQPSPRVAQVPWELIAPDAHMRLIDIADISLLAPLSIVHAPGRSPRSWRHTRELPVVAVLDPRVPGYRADSVLGSVLGRMSGEAPLSRHIAEYAEQNRLEPRVTDPTGMFRREDVDREWLGEALRGGASRLIYVGHVTAAVPESGQSEHAELHLACRAETIGFAEATRAHRPLSAKDLLLGTHALTDDPVAGPDLWPIPSRVALIACESGGDLRFGEALGLVSAMISGGAELVTASRWTLPTDLAFERLAGARPGERPLQSAICSVDSAHESPDAVNALCDWQRERSSAWREERTIAHSPVLWGAFATVST
ncbi:CHAT domain-containing protein [Rhodococcus tibetensis]|uniref:CHAT domain-containing protein n=1 Tax=Rhodococcus tibetensis TaxID=2965064 RepID=A0ABT1QHR5_9NOCA|nr:CHAT domain-containing protein [Rhodococcus sp. FXJ9.536]MCQ4121831.1 CHAT domain-containing protein [Rhodococcus sp. FXJ9.536]